MDTNKIKRTKSSFKSVGRKPIALAIAMVCFLGISSTLIGCQKQKLDNQIEYGIIDQPETWQIHLKKVKLTRGTQLATRETIYLPVYSHIYSQDHIMMKIELAETVSIRNTDFDQPIILTSVRHYQTDGSLIKEYIKEPLQVNAMATADFVVPKNDTTGGSGANFIIEWVSKSKVSKPITESIMIYAASSHSISFLSRGEVIKKEENITLTEKDCAKWNPTQNNNKI